MTVMRGFLPALMDRERCTLYKARQISGEYHWLKNATLDDVMDQMISAELGEKSWLEKFIDRKKLAAKLLKEGYSEHETGVLLKVGGNQG